MPGVPLLTHRDGRTAAAAPLACRNVDLCRYTDRMSTILLCTVAGMAHMSLWHTCHYDTHVIMTHVSL